MTADRGIIVKHRKTGATRKFVVDGPRHFRDAYTGQKFTSTHVATHYIK